MSEEYNSPQYPGRGVEIWADVVRPDFPHPATHEGSIVTANLGDILLKVAAARFEDLQRLYPFRIVSRKGRKSIVKVTVSGRSC